MTFESIEKVAQEASQNIADYKYCKKYYPDQLKEYRSQKENFKLRLKSGDIGQVMSLPGVLKGLLDEKKKKT